MIAKILLPFLLGLNLTLKAHAEVDAGAPDAALPETKIKEECNKDGSKCYLSASKEDGLSAFENLKQKLTKEVREVSVSELAVIGGGSTSAVATTTGLLLYRQQLKTVAQTAALVKEQTIIIKAAVEKAFAPELARYAEALFKLNEQNAAKGLPKLTAAEVRIRMYNGLNSPEVKKRIIAKMTEVISESSARGVATELAEDLFEKTVKSSSTVISKNWGGSVEKLMAKGIYNGAKAGSSLATSLAEQSAKSMAKPFAEKILTFAASKAGGVLAKCGGLLARLVGSRALGFLGSAWFGAALILLEPSPLARGTMDDFYAAHPEALLDIPESQAQYWISNYVNVRRSVVAYNEALVESEMIAGKDPGPVFCEDNGPNQSLRHDPNETFAPAERCYLN